MQIPPVPLDEIHRLDSVRELAIVDTPGEERFDRITRLATRVFGVSSATIGLIEQKREWIKSVAGFPHVQLAREVSFAGHAIGAGELMVVEDARRDPRFHDNPLVLDEPRVRFYAGQPLHARNGSQPGVLNIYDSAPRMFSMEDRQTLSDLAAIAEKELRETGLSTSQLEIAVPDGPSRDLSRIDPLTRLWNRAAMFDIARRELEEARIRETGVALAVIEVDLVSEMGAQEDPGTSDRLLREMARLLRTSLRPYDVIARFAGKEFVALLPGVNRETAFDTANRIRLAIRNQLRLTLGRDVEMTFGVATVGASAEDPESLVRMAQSALWAANKRGGDTVEVFDGSSQHRDIDSKNGRFSAQGRPLDGS